MNKILQKAVISHKIQNIMLKPGQYGFDDFCWLTGYLAPHVYYTRKDVRRQKKNPVFQRFRQNDNRIELATYEGQGKITDAGYDQFTGIFTSIPSEMDFEFSAIITVQDFPAKEELNYQEGLGLFVRDTMALMPETGYPYSNMLLTGGCMGGWNVFGRSGISKESVEYIKNDHALSCDSAARITLQDKVKILIRKQNGSIEAKIMDAAGTEIVRSHTAYDAKCLLNIEKKSIYIGFLAARKCCMIIEKDTVCISILRKNMAVFYENHASDVEKPDISRAQAKAQEIHIIVEGDIHVSPDGRPDGDGTPEQPLDFQSAVNICDSGQTVKLAAGHYLLSDDVVIPVNERRTPDNKKKKIICEAAPAKYAILDFQKKECGLIVQGSGWDISGLTVTHGMGFQIRGSHNHISDCRAICNLETGFLIRHERNDSPYAEWPSYNIVTDCLSCGNKDISEQNADGFACKVSAGEGNEFVRCRAFLNSDDGFDLFSKNRKTGPVKLKQCISCLNGYKYEEGSLKATEGNGNGFKLGGSGLAIRHLAEECQAAGNRKYGFTSNSNPVMQLKECISENNGNNYMFYFTSPAAEPENDLRNCTEIIDPDYDPYKLLDEKNIMEILCQEQTN